MKESERNPLVAWVQNAIGRVREFAYAPRPPMPTEAPRAPRLGMALGGGFARGIAHLGILRVLEEQGIPVHCISGTSAGALAGLAYATGKPFDEIALAAARLRFGSFGKWKLSRLGLASNLPLEQYPERILGVHNFEELKVPLAIAATDLMTGEPVYFQKGSLGIALRASCAYPGLFQPVEYEGRLLVDGFVAETVPVNAARRMGADVVIAVFLEAEAMILPKTIMDVVGRSFSIIQHQADMGWRAKADLVITPNVREFAWDDFSKTPQIIAAGAEAANEALPRITNLLKRAAEQQRQTA
jgi:NTE family protein